MKNYLLAERYARALSESLETSELEQATQTLRALADLYEAQHDLRSVLSNPSLAMERRAAVLAEVLEKMAMPTATARLVHIVLKRGRIALLSEVADSFERQVDERLGRIGALATTAIGMSEETCDVLKAGLTRFSDKEVRLACEVDPAIAGGVVVRLGGLLLDGSLRTRLRRIAEDLLSRDIEAG